MNNPLSKWSDLSLSFSKRHFGVFAKLGSLAIVDQMVVSGTRFASTLLIGRFCGPEELGVYSLGFSILVLISVVQESLIATPYTVLGNREIGQKRLEYSGSVLIHSAALAIVATGGLAVVALLTPQLVDGAEIVTVIWLLVAILPFTLLREFARKFCFAHIKIKSALAIDSIVAVLQLGTLAVLAWLELLTAKTAFLTMGVTCLIASIGWLAGSRRAFVFKKLHASALLPRHWNFGKWLLGGQVVGVFAQWASYWLLAFIASTVETGIFAACMSIVMLSNPLILGMSNILDPRLARAFADGGHTELRRIVKKVTLIMGAALGLFFFTLLLIGDQLIEFLYDDPIYAGHGHMISILALSVVFSAIGMGSNMGLRPLERTDLSFYLKLVDLAIIMFASIPLVIHWGMLGGAYALLMASIVGSISRCWVFVYILGRSASQPRTS